MCVYEVFFIHISYVWVYYVCRRFTGGVNEDSD